MIGTMGTKRGTTAGRRKGKVTMKIIAHTDIFARARIVNGYSQRELARRSGLSYGYISMIERGEKSVGPAAAKKLSELLDKPLEELFRIE